MRSGIKIYQGIAYPYVTFNSLFEMHEMTLLRTGWINLFTFNSLFEMPETAVRGSPAPKAEAFNSLFEMPRATSIAG